MLIEGVSVCRLVTSTAVSHPRVSHVFFLSGFLAPAQENFAPNPVEFYEFYSVSVVFEWSLFYDDVTESGRFPMSDVPATSG